jgi:long-chain fatty acid transport protein
MRDRFRSIFRRTAPVVASLNPFQESLMRASAQTRRASTRRRVAAVLCSLPFAVHARVSSAQGFGLNEIGSCAIARGFAATGSPCEDVSTVYWNPAAATTLRGLSVYAGASAIAVRGSFTADTTGRVDRSDVPTEYPPFLGVNWTPASHRYALGVAAYVPYGLTSQWGQDFAGRFSAQKASLQSVYVQPNVAVELVPGKFSVGGGPTIGWSQLELRQSLDISAQPAQAGVTFAQLGVAPGTEFARVRLKGSGTGVGFNVGAHWQPTPELSLGARYLSKVRFKYDGADATFTPSPTGLTLFPGNPLIPAGTQVPPTGVPLDAVLAGQFTGSGLLRPGQQASTQIDFPAQFQAGVGYGGIANTMISVDYALVQWSAFASLPVNFGTGSPLTRVLREDYENSSSVRAGLDHRFGAAPTGVALRLGFVYAQSPAPDVTVTPLLPDMDRYDFTGGLGIPLGDRFALDASYLRVETQGRRGRVIERTAESQTAAQLNGGWYALSANIISLSLKAQF